MKLFICLSLTLIFMFITYIRKSITFRGIITGGIITFGLAYYGGIPMFLMIFLFYIVDKIFCIITDDHNDDQRNEIQILANTIIPYICVLLYAYYKKDIFLVLASAAFAECLADTLASTIGKHAKYHICLRNFKRDEEELSGVVSALGILASLFGSLIIAFTYYELINTNFYHFIVITVLGVAGALIDSILGAFVQNKYQCSKCKNIVEEKKHCNRKTKKISGFLFIDNSMVNFLSVLITVIIGIIILIL